MPFAHGQPLVMRKYWLAVSKGLLLITVKVIRGSSFYFGEKNIIFC